MTTADITPQFHLYIEQGVDYNHTFQWLNGGMFMAPIELIQEGYPTVITVTGHGLNSVAAHPVILSGIEGIPRLNSENTEQFLVTRLDDNRFSVPASSVGKQWVPGTGELTYHKPTDMTGYTGRCVIRRNWYEADSIHEMTTENGGMILELVSGSIQLVVPKALNADFTFRHAWYDVDMTSSAGVETRVFKGPVTLEREVSP
jgi:hypothetical protein